MSYEVAKAGATLTTSTYRYSLTRAAQRIVVVFTLSHPFFDDVSLGCHETNTWIVSLREQHPRNVEINLRCGVVDNIMRSYTLKRL